MKNVSLFPCEIGEQRECNMLHWLCVRNTHVRFACDALHIDAETFQTKSNSCLFIHNASVWEALVVCYSSEFKPITRTILKKPKSTRLCEGTCIKSTRCWFSCCLERAVMRSTNVPARTNFIATNFCFVSISIILFRFD